MTNDQVSHHTATVKDVRLHYFVAGQGEPLVLLHGWPQDSSAWAPLVPALAARYTVIAPDLRGMGLSSRPAAGYDTDNVADDVYELVRSLGHDRVLLAGHDWGAATAYSYAAQHPEQIRRLAILEMVLPGFGIMEQAMVPQPGGRFLWHMGFQAVPDIAQTLMTGHVAEYLQFMFQQYAYDPHAVRPDRMRHYIDGMLQVGALRAGLGYYQDYFTSAAQNETHRKTRLPMPVLALGGEACLGPLPRQCLELAADDVSGGTVERCGHWMTEERPQHLASEMLSFFGGSEAT